MHVHLSERLRLLLERQLFSEERLPWLSSEERVSSSSTRNGAALIRLDLCGVRP